MNIKTVLQSVLEKIRNSGVKTAFAAASLKVEQLADILKVSRSEARTISANLIFGAAALGNRWAPKKSRPEPFGIEDAGYKLAIDASKAERKSVKKAG